MGVLDLTHMGLTVTSFETLSSVTMEMVFDTLKQAYPRAPKIHLPRYSPNLNPVERCGKRMNKPVRNHIFLSAKAFRERIILIP
jgi:hypothetical protein